VKQAFDVLERKRSKLSRETPSHWNADAEEAIAGTILPLGGPEEALEKRGVLAVAE
jgi:hypothetical protein